MKIPRYLRPVGAGPVPALAPSENNKISNHRSQITNSGSSPAKSICYFRSVICDLLFSETLRKGAHGWRPYRAFSCAVVPLALGIRFCKDNCDVGYQDPACVIGR